MSNNKLAKPQNENYAATVFEVGENDLRPLSGCDNVQALAVRGYQAIVGLDVKPGTKGLLFRAETALEPAFLAANNLYRDSSLNEGTDTGYFEKHGRVRAVRFRGHPSDAFFIPLRALEYLLRHTDLYRFRDMSQLIDSLEDGDVFDNLLGQRICFKYEPPTSGAQRVVDKNATKKFKRVESKYLPEHYDTPQYRWYVDQLAPDQQIVVTQKLHGTSVRIGRTYVNRQLTWKERLAKRFGVKVAEQEIGVVIGSRKVIKDPTNDSHNHYYSTDIWGAAGSEVAAVLPDNFIVYGEIIGYVGTSKEIQKNYTYNTEPGEAKVYIYRVAVITSAGRVVDLSWDNVQEFCADYGLNVVPELWRGLRKDFDPEAYKDTRYFESGYPQAVPMSTKKSAKLVDEGICVRAEGRAPLILKAKSPKFLEHETKMLDAEEADIETTGLTEQPS